MAKEKTVPVIVHRTEMERDSQQMLGPLRIGCRLVEVNQAVIAESLQRLVSGLSEIVGTVQQQGSAKLTEVSIAVQLTGEGGLAWIGEARAGVSNSMVLTFSLD